MDPYAAEDGISQTRERTASRLAWSAFKRQCTSRDPVVFGIGAFEQHGEHLPMGTDFIIADALARALAIPIGGITLPTLPYGAPSRPRSGGAVTCSARRT